MQLFLAGGESWWSTFLDLGISHSLYSYFYIRNKLRSGDALSMHLRMGKAKELGYHFMLDSGAFTYQAKVEKEGSKLPHVEDYFEEYMDYCARWGHLYDVIVELDVDNALEDVTTEQVDAWTNRLIEKLGPKVMPVYHVHRSKAWLRSWLIDMGSPYVGFSSSAGSGSGATFSALAHRFGKFVHAFGQTRLFTEMKYSHYDSSDSSSWLRGDRFGDSCYFQNGKFTVVDGVRKAERPRYKKYYEKWGLDFDKIMQDDLAENRKANLVAWRELSNSLLLKESFADSPAYLWSYCKKHGRMPKEHPLIERLLRQSVLKESE